MNNRGKKRITRGGFRGKSYRLGFNKGGNRGWRGNNPENPDNRNQSNYIQWTKKPARDSPGVRLIEENIAVTEYMTDHKGFNGIIKLRYADFQVSEVNEQGQVAKLTDLKPPEPPAAELIDNDEDLLLNKYNLEILPMETWDGINTIALAPSSCTDVVEIDVLEMTKEQRTKIHDAVKKAFGTNIVGSTINTDDGKKFMRFERFRIGGNFDKRVKWIWPGEYVHFMVYKENIDTMEAATKIAERLRLMSIKPSMIGYAGTKDKRAKTTQWFSLRKVDPRCIAQSCMEIRDVLVGNYSLHKNQVKLGMLKGNMFRIALRNVEESDEVVESACENLKNRGFINYYGLQRFGSRVDSPTWEIGKKLLQENYKEVADGILSDREGPMQEVLRVYNERGAAEAMRLMSRSARAAAAGVHYTEIKLLTALAKNSKDVLSAIQHAIPRNMRLLYVHAYQSIIYNRAVTHRLRSLGFQPAVGDLVTVNDTDDTYEDNVGIDESGFDTQDADENNESDKIVDSNNETGDEDDEKPMIVVKMLTQEDIDSGRYTLYDVVMPLPGYNIEYPSNMKDYYEEQLKQDGLSLNMRHRIKSYYMCGTYRRMCVRPTNVSWRCVRYSDPHADLLTSDRDDLDGNNELGIIPDGKYKAVLLRMMLPASCYATMALRELMKVDTSSMTQALQNDYHKTETLPSKRTAAGSDDDEGVKKTKVE